MRGSQRPQQMSGKHDALFIGYFQLRTLLQMNPQTRWLRSHWRGRCGYRFHKG